ncbi:MAG: pyruvate, phosphate dikinase [Nitrospira sp. SB0677_bin_15]|nr:pyruvate, phosphate dikinase [Nitrospira sp. SB0661_bin_20]MYG40345.1 pyruvate, phosphate dikinase [Nitrospira sp. SB0677_bin_15]MYH01708.1 pyruvate, phosphate dikinase [Nitrospira sp. SB0675_bin_23]MYJ23625.1 pyruvate, phosphate dikinase [Nitrospira sp. SB0673_bin_12]
MPTKKYVYSFGDGKAEGTGTMKALLGGKGAGLAEMTNLKISVPPGFTITTDACLEYFKAKKRYPAGMWDQTLKGLKRVERLMNARIGDSRNPLLVSVRSGARASMPGMMDTVLNLGLNSKTVTGLADRTNNPRFAMDSYRRFITMFGSVVMDVPREKFDEVLESKKQEVGAANDTDLSAKDLREVVAAYQRLVQQETGRAFPDDPLDQLDMAVRAVFASWFGDRAVTYRKIYDIPDAWGTAVNVVAMVFGNMGETSGTGVMFSRNPSTGERAIFGECLLNAQGEDVVAGLRTPLPVSALKDTLPAAYRSLMTTQKILEKHYCDMQDMEFTIQEGKLYMLQTRVGKRTGIAAVRVAVDMVKERLIDKREAVRRVEPEQLAQYLYPVFERAEEKKFQPIGKGLPAGPGAACGKIALTPDQAVALKARGEKAVLVRKETSPDDIHGMHAAEGFLTATGGMTSHAAVVARQMGKVCVAGCEDVEVFEEEAKVRIGPSVFKEGDYISINGFSGFVYGGMLSVMDSEVIRALQGKDSTAQPDKVRYFFTILKWADEIRRLNVRANADAPDQAGIARGFGAEGIGLCRTEHMFFSEDRVPIMQAMILASNRTERERYLEQLLPLQKQDFIGLYREMKGYPVTIRLLDPPLHEFLPKREQLMVDVARAEASQVPSPEVEEKRKMLARVEELHEFNPMLGLRGCRLGITMPEITRMQVRAIMEAACEVAREGKKIVPEIMIPLVGMASEMKAQKALIKEVAEETMQRYGKRLTYLVGTMIELPRAAVTAGQIAEDAEFFSFGTNDLTQTTYGFSRDDAARFTGFYREHDLLAFDPFAVLDREGVGAVMRLAMREGRAARPDIKLGICGEHGGEPSSVEFCHQLGLDYVSCSPYRVAIARLAAAQAALHEDDQRQAAKPKKRSAPARSKVRGRSRKPPSRR